MNFDVFNGDADGICALHQLRLADPTESKLVTGVKRDIKLLEKLSGIRESKITVLDISMDANKTGLLELLRNGNKIQYFDHHFCGDIPDHLNLEAHIDTSSNVCTSLLVDNYVDGQYRLWAIVATFGDNIHTKANDLASDLNLTDIQINQLRELGELINYNSYGQEINDLHIPPTTLYHAIQPFKNPFDFYNESKTIVKLKAGYKEDMLRAHLYNPAKQSSVGSIYLFPAEPWCKRVAGVFSNSIARDEPNFAHALLIDNGDDSYLVSVRSPINKPTGADELCREFATGGGRQSAAGINQLPENDVQRFIKSFENIFTYI